MSDLNVSPSQMATFITATFRAVGLPEDDARTVGALMAEADVQGSDGHGVIRVPVYIRRIVGGAVNVTPNIRVVQERAATALIDGDNGMSHLVMKRATELAIEKARTCGMRWRMTWWACISRWAMPTTCQPGAVWTCCFRPTRSPPLSRRTKNPRWCWTWPLPWRPMAKSKPKT